MPKKFKVLKVRDKTDNYSQKVERLWDVPFRALLVAKSGHGKSNLLTNMLLNEKLGYKRLFDGEDIHIFAPSIKNDEKMKLIIEQKDIPDHNLHEDYSDQLLLDVYESLIDDYKESIADRVQPTYKLIILDDLSYGGGFANNRFNALSKVYCNSRKWLISVICLQQLYSHTTPTIRNNASILFFFNTPTSQIDQIEADHNYLQSKKDFVKMFRETVKDKHSFLCVNYSNDYKDLYLDSEFNSVLGEKDAEKKDSK